VVFDAVTAAEQLGLTDQLKDYADTKMDYAISYVEQALKGYGYDIDLDPIMDMIVGMIEAEVNRQFPPSRIEYKQPTLRSTPGEM
jgi:hypothetical protein